MQATETDQRSVTREILDSSLPWMTMLIFGIALCTFLWQDFARLFRWIGA